MAKKLLITDPNINDEINIRADQRAQTIIDAQTKNPMFIRHPLSRVRYHTHTDGVSMTHQSHAESCDINNIIRQFDRTGILPPPRKQGQFADVSNLNKDLTDLTLDAKEAGERIRQAQADAKKAQKNPPPPAETPTTPPPEPHKPSKPPVNPEID